MREAIRCNEGGHLVQLGRPSGALEAISGHQWPSVAVSGTRLLLTRHTRLRLRLRRRLRLLHPQRLGRPSRLLTLLLGRLRTLQPLCFLALPCLRARRTIKGNRGQLEAIKGN
jgi:hypothetical protein